jgi:hypothetical protein
MRPLAFAVTTTLCLSLAPATAVASSIQIAGTTAGCFGDGCSSFSDEASFGAYSFDGVTFEITPDGDIATVSLGSFTRGNDFLAEPIPFTLQIAFSTPDGVIVVQYLGTLSLAVSASGAGPAWLDFDNAFLCVSAPEGPFGFSVLDVGNAGNGRHGLTRNRSRQITGLLRLPGLAGCADEPEGLAFAAPSSLVPQQISEPASLLLLGMALLGIGIHARRARRAAAIGSGRG